MCDKKEAVRTNQQLLLLVGKLNNYTVCWENEKDTGGPSQSQNKITHRDDQKSSR